jgi:hypothetical protein
MKGNDVHLFKNQNPLFPEEPNEIVNQLGDGGILADDDEARRHPNAIFLPELEG